MNCKKETTCPTCEQQGNNPEYSHSPAISDLYLSVMPDGPVSPSDSDPSINLDSGATSGFDSEDYKPPTNADISEFNNDESKPGVKGDNGGIFKNSTGPIQFTSSGSVMVLHQLVIKAASISVDKQRRCSLVC